MEPEKGRGISGGGFDIGMITKLWYSLKNVKCVNFGGNGKLLVNN